MSANNQTLIKEHKGKWYVFVNVMAESWCNPDGSHENELRLSSADAVCDSRDEAYAKALELDAKDENEWGEEEGTEYGVQFNRLCKDDAEVKIVESKSEE